MGECRRLVRGGRGARYRTAGGIGLTWLCVYTAAVGALAHNHVFRRVTEALSGVVLIALGARLALER